MDMKWLGILATLWVMMPILAQAQQDPVPDTTDWREYFPLQIGNLWEHKYGNDFWGEYPEGYERREIVGDTLIEGTHYFVHQVRRYDAEFELSGSWIDLLRYDTTRTVIAALVEKESVVQEQPWPEPAYTCDLSAAFYSDFDCYDCPDCGSVSVYGYYNEQVIFQLGELESSIVKMFTRRGAGYGIGFVHGVGVIVVDADFELGYRNDVIFVRLNGEEYGHSEVATNIEEDVGELPQATSIVSVFPNPFETKTTITYKLSSPQRISAEVYNVMGQRVRHVEVGWRPAGTHSTEIEGQGLASGVYFLHIASETGDHAVKQIVLQR